jgi:hypothetical protein
MLLIGFANTTDNPAYFRRLNSFSVQHTTAGHGKFLPTWSRPRGRHAPETISQDFEQLRLEEVYGAIANSLANQANFDAYLVRQNEKRAEGRRDAEPLPCQSAGETDARSRRTPPHRLS